MSQSQKKYFHNSWRFEKYCIFAAQFKKMQHDGEKQGWQSIVSRAVVKNPMQVLSSKLVTRPSKVCQM